MAHGPAFSNRLPFSTAAVSSSPDNADTVCAGEARAAGAAADEGVIPRALRRCFERVEELPDRVFTIRVSFLEIYNESLRDLLVDPTRPAGAAPARLDIVDVRKGRAVTGVVVRGLNKLAVSSADEVRDDELLSRAHRT